MCQHARDLLRGGKCTKGSVLNARRWEKELCVKVSTCQGLIAGGKCTKGSSISAQRDGKTDLCQCVNMSGTYCG
jgi:hypothetical protein